MRKLIEHKPERLALIKKHAAKHKGVYSKVARDLGTSRFYVSSVMAGRNSSNNVMTALERELKISYND